MSKPKLLNIGMPDCPFCGLQMKAEEKGGFIAVGCWGSGECWYVLDTADDTPDGVGLEDNPYKIGSIQNALKLAGRRAE